MDEVYGNLSVTGPLYPRAACAVIDDEAIAIRRADYGNEREARGLFDARDPDAAWIAARLRTGTCVTPPADAR